MSSTSRDDTDPHIRRVLVTRKLVLRQKASLGSKKLGEVARGAVVLVVDEDLVDGVVRCRLGTDSSPRGACVHDLGWVTAYKEGELKLVPIAMGAGSGSSAAAGAAAHGASSADVRTGTSALPELPWSTKRLGTTTRARGLEVDLDFQISLQPPPPSPGDSLASRIAKRRQGYAKERLSKKLSARFSEPHLEPHASSEATGAGLGSREGTAAAAVHAAAEVASEAEAAVTDAAAAAAKEAAKFVWTSSASLLAMADEQVAQAVAEESSAQARFDTVDAKLGRLLLQKRTNLTDLMKEV